MCTYCNFKVRWCHYRNGVIVSINVFFFSNVSLSILFLSTSIGCFLRRDGITMSWDYSQSRGHSLSLLYGLFCIIWCETQIQQSHLNSVYQSKFFLVLNTLDCSPKWLRFNCQDKRKKYVESSCDNIQRKKISGVTNFYLNWSCKTHLTHIDTDTNTVCM